GVAAIRIDAPDLRNAALRSRIENALSIGRPAGPLCQIRNLMRRTAAGHRNRPDALRTLIGGEIRQRDAKRNSLAIRRNLRIADALDLQQRVGIKRLLLSE